jgi:hypothetical protein
LLYRYYCGKSCQTKDWPSHKSFHKSMVDQEGNVLKGTAASFQGQLVSLSSESNSIGQNGISALLKCLSEGCLAQAKALRSRAGRRPHHTGIPSRPGSNKPVRYSSHVVKPQWCAPVWEGADRAQSRCCGCGRRVQPSPRPAPVTVTLSVTVASR